MPRTGQKLFTCPSCKRKGVSRQEDYDTIYACRYCPPWYAYSDGRNPEDVVNLEALREANPDRADEIRV